VFACVCFHCNVVVQEEEDREQGVVNFWGIVACREEKSLIVSFQCLKLIYNNNI
jgi:hypothetical protein